MIVDVHPQSWRPTVSTADRARAIHARLAGLLDGEGDALLVRVVDGVARVTAVTSGQTCRLEADLGDPDAELVLAARLACLVAAAKRPAA